MKTTKRVTGIVNYETHQKALLLVLLLCASGCRFMGPPMHLVAYDGPRKPPSEVAKIVGAGDSFASELLAGGLLGNSKVSILNVDGKAQRVGADSVKLLNWVEVLPGPHEITLLMRAHNAGLLGLGASDIETSPVRLSFLAEAGHTYVVCGTYQLRPPETWFWIVDQTTGEIVAGRKP